MHLKTLLALACLAFIPLAVAQEDPYFWLEEVDGDKAMDWVKTENASTAERLTNSPLFDELYAQAKTVLNSSSRIANVNQVGDWLYNFWRDETNPRGVYRRTTLKQFASDSPDWEVVIDIDALNKKENKQWVLRVWAACRNTPNIAGYVCPPVGATQWLPESLILSTRPL